MISHWLFKANLLVTILVIFNAKRISSNKQCTLITIDYALQEVNKCELGQPALRITYPNTRESIVCNSTQLLPTVKTQPEVVFSNAQQGNTYALAMVDPDAPSSHGTYFLHWLLANITGNDLKHGDLNYVFVLDSYYPPSPPKGTGFHRYQFFVFNQPSWQTNVTRSGTSRSKFNLKEFASVNGLCEPIASIQFLAEFVRKE